MNVSYFYKYSVLFESRTFTDPAIRDHFYRGISQFYRFTEGDNLIARQAFEEVRDVIRVPGSPQLRRKHEVQRIAKAESHVVGALALTMFLEQGGKLR